MRIARVRGPLADVEREHLITVIICRDPDIRDLHLVASVPRDRRHSRKSPGHVYGLRGSHFLRRASDSLFHKAVVRT